MIIEVLFLTIFLPTVSKIIFFFGFVVLFYLLKRTGVIFV